MLAQEEHFVIAFRVRPAASVTRFTSTMADGSLKIDLAAVPEDGAANEELIRFLAEEFDVPQSAVTIISGHASRRKLVRIDSR
ncbi:DUF167 domain-containing protein [Candidatus Peregrinibacteria bacterium]|nr:DUF167 domain-containing protein [Candidatus Peregrinibacteria bacterium]